MKAATTALLSLDVLFAISPRPARRYMKKHCKTKLIIREYRRLRRYVRKQMMESAAGDMEGWTVAAHPIESTMYIAGNTATKLRQLLITG